MMAKWNVIHIEARLNLAIAAMEEAIKVGNKAHYGDGDTALDNCFDAMQVLEQALTRIKGVRDTRNG
tara:strand:+ start:379 stop:579 length:201 start_codon:yes stop_codon:yes gene_type:complete